MSDDWLIKTESEPAAIFLGRWSATVRRNGHAVRFIFASTEARARRKAERWIDRHATNSGSCYYYTPKGEAK